MNGGNEARQNVDLLLRITQMGLDTCNTLANLVYEAMLYFDKHSINKELMNSIKEKNVFATVVDEKNVSEFTKKLNNHGINFESFYDNENKVNYVIYDKKDALRVKNLTDEIRIEQGLRGNIDKELLFKDGFEKINKIQDLSLVETVRLAEYCNKNNLAISIQDAGRGKYSCYYKISDYDKINNLLKKTCLDLSGVQGNILKKQIVYENKQFKENLEKLQSKENFFIVGKNGDYIESKDDQLLVVNDEKNISLNKYNKEFYSVSNYFLSELEEPVKMNSAQFEKYNSLKNNEDKLKYMVEVDIKNGRPIPNAEEMQARKEFFEEKEEYEQKLALDNQDEELIPCDLEDNNLRLGSVIIAEKINREVNYDKSEPIENPDNLINAAIGRFKGLKDREDKIVERVEDLNRLEREYARDELDMKIEPLDRVDQAASFNEIFDNEIMDEGEIDND